MAKTRTIFSCQHCGSQSPKWLGRCPDCGEWNSFVEEAPAIVSKRSPIPEAVSTPIALQNIRGDEGKHLAIGIDEFDRVLGGGLVPGSVTLVGGDPGIGKSTIMLQVFAALAKNKQQSLYISGEESAAQIKMRAERLGIQEDTIFVATENCLEQIIEHIRKTSPFAVAIDSIQTVYSNDIQSAPGTISQVRESAGKLVTACKHLGIALFLIGHVTKEGAIAGPKVLEHMVDTVLYFEGERGHAYRILRTIKNRFGSTNEIGVFEMTGNGLAEVKNPSGIFLAERAEARAGSVVVATLEGTRPMLLEIQALVAGSGLTNPRRTSLGVDNNRTSMIVAVLEKVSGINLYDQDIFVNVAGGMRITEPASDLAVASAIRSSFLSRPLDPRTLVIGEIGLTGEVRAVIGVEARLAEGAKMGFTRAMIPQGNAKGKAPKGMEVEAVDQLDRCFEILS